MAIVTEVPTDLERDVRGWLVLRRTSDQEIIIESGIPENSPAEISYEIRTLADSIAYVMRTPNANTDVRVVINAEGITVLDGSRNIPRNKDGGGMYTIAGGVRPVVLQVYIDGELHHQSRYD